MCITAHTGLFWGERLDKQTIQLSIMVLDRSLLSDVLLPSKKTFLSLELNEVITALNNLNRYFVIRFSYEKKNVLEQT